MNQVQCYNSNVDSSTLCLYEKALLIRLTELTLLDLFKQGKLFGTVHTCIGQEFTGVAVAENLLVGDTIFSNHRCHGHFLSRTSNVKGLLAELMGFTTGVSGGKGGSQHLCQGGFFSNGIQGGIVPVSAGLAMAHRFSQASNISVVFIGDGTLGEGVVYETLNLAAKWNLPLLFVLEDNQYAQSTSNKQTMAGSVEGRAKAFDVEYKSADTWDIPQLLYTTKNAVNFVRTYTKPLLLHIHTYRLAAHSKGDDDRDLNEINAYKILDPLNIFERENPDLFRVLKTQAEKSINNALLEIESNPFQKTSIVSIREKIAYAMPEWEIHEQKRNERVNTLIYGSLLNNMEKNSRIILIGEDIEHPYGGAFKVTRDLSLRFPDRVRNTPISEACIIGIGNGLALQGYLPVCEIMFGDFILLAADQLINHAAKFKYMYNEQVSVPMIVRTPMGGGRGYGPTHSQSLEKHFLGVPGIQIISLNGRLDPSIIYDNLFSTISCPTIVVENKLLYSKKIANCDYKGFYTYISTEVFPTVRIVMQRAVPDVTVLCYGGTLSEVERAANSLFEEEEIVVEIICPSLIYPLQLSALIESLEKSHRLITVEEGQGFAGLGAEVISQIIEYDAKLISKGVRRLFADEHPIPASGWMEEAALPKANDIIQTAKELVL